MLITVIGRGHSGTRAIAKTLSESGVFMGDQLNIANDLLPPEDMYEACRVIARHVEYLGDYRWNFSRLHTMPIDPAFTRLLESYLSSVLASESEHKGWKIPETTLCYPWIIRLFPDARYILWSRDPRDVILGEHLTDDLSDFGVPWPYTSDVTEARAVSWLYQAQIVAETPPPRHTIAVRLSDFVRHQEDTLGRLEVFLGFPLARVEVRPEALDRWRLRPEPLRVPEFLEQALRQYGYLEEESSEPAT